MSDPFRTPEERAHWERIAQERFEAVRKVKVERARTRRLLDAAAARAAQLPEGPEQAYVRAYKDLLESFMRHVQLQDVDNEVWNVPDNATLAAIEWESLESTAALLRMGRLNFTRLASAIDADLAPALEGAEAPADLPTAWLTLRASLGARAEWAESLRRFRQEFVPYESQVAQALDAFDALRSLPPSPERLQKAKAAGLPAAKGVQYRLEATFRRLPDGEAFLAGMRYPLPDAGKDSAEASVPRKRSLTDQVLGFLNKKQ